MAKTASAQPAAQAPVLSKIDRHQAGQEMKSLLALWVRDWRDALLQENRQPPGRLTQSESFQKLAGKSSINGGWGFPAMTLDLNEHGESNRAEEQARAYGGGRAGRNGREKAPQISDAARLARFAQFQAEQKELVLALARDGWIFGDSSVKFVQGSAQSEHTRFHAECANQFIRWAVKSDAVLEAVAIPGLAAQVGGAMPMHTEEDSEWGLPNPWLARRSTPRTSAGGMMGGREEDLWRAKQKMGDFQAAQPLFDGLEKNGAIQATQAGHEKPVNPWLARMIVWLDGERIGRAAEMGASLEGLSDDYKRSLWARWLKSAAAALSVSHSESLKASKKLVEESLDASFAAGLGEKSWSYRAVPPKSLNAAQKKAHDALSSWKVDDFGRSMMSIGIALGPVRAKFILERLIERGVDIGADMPSMIVMGAVATGGAAPKARQDFLAWAFGTMRQPPVWNRRRWSEIYAYDLLKSDAMMARLHELGARIHAPQDESAIYRGPFLLASRDLRGPSTFDALLKLGAQMTEETHVRETLAHWTAEREDAEAASVMEWALAQLPSAEERRAFVSGPQKDGLTPVMLAAKALQGETVRVLAKNGADMKAVDKKGNGVVQALSRRSGAAAEVRMPDVVEALQEAGVNWEEKDGKGRLAIALVVKKAPVKALGKLVQYAPQAFEAQGASLAFGKNKGLKSAQDVLQKRGGEGLAVVESGQLEAIGQAAKDKRAAEDAAAAARGDSLDHAPALSKRRGNRI